MENTFKGFPGSNNLTVYTYHRFSVPDDNEDFCHISIYVYVDIGSLFLGRGLFISFFSYKVY